MGWRKSHIPCSIPDNGNADAQGEQDSKAAQALQVGSRATSYMIIATLLKNMCWKYAKMDFKAGSDCTGPFNILENYFPEVRMSSDLLS